MGSTEYGYNTRGHLTSITNDIGGNAYGQYYSYSQTDIEGTLPNAKDGLPTRYRALGVNTDYAYDSLNRLTKRNVDLATDIETLYTYKDSALRGTGYTTTQLATEKLGGISYGYSYDNMGNITSIVKGSNAYRSYLYDSLGQLTQERNVSSNTMTSFTYNHLGNITEKHIDDYNGINEKAKVRYGYSADSNAGWKYLLTSITTVNYTDGGSTTTETIDYDAIGNPITYRGAAMAWRGRQLTGHTKNGVTSTFSYDADGLRSSKTVGGVKTEYQYIGDQLFYEKRGESQEFYYFYDSYGNLSKIYYTFINTQNNTTSRAIYHALTNAQGDVIALYNGSGTLVAQYEYDAWGNTLSIKNVSGADITAWYNIAVANPIRYRGYYYDADLGLYYLQSRYYDSTTGRFINADGYITTGQGVLSYNMYAYCGNNPVNRSDYSGYSFEDIRNFFNEVFESIGIFNRIKEFFDQIATPFNVAKAFAGPPKRLVEHTKNVVNTIYNQDNMNSTAQLAPVSEDFEPYEIIEARSGVSYTSHIDTIINEPTIEYLTDITKGRSWDEIVEDGDVYEVCHTMINWDNVMYNELIVYNQADLTYTTYDALY